MTRKRLFSLFLALCLAITGVLVPGISVAAAESKVTVTELNNGSQIVEASETRDAFKYLEKNSESGGKVVPAVIVGGIMQSITYMYKTNSDGKKEILKSEDGSLIMESGDIAFMIDTPAIKKSVFKELGTILKFLFTGNNKGLAGSIASILDAGLGAHYFNPDGTRASKDITFETEEYNYSLAVAATKENSLNKYKLEGSYKYGGGGPTELGYITSQINMQEYCDLVGYENVFYFAYESFGDTYDIARRLNNYIENVVKAQTGADKVNLVFISLGGTISTAYFDLYAHTGEMNEVNKVLFADSAIDGSYLLSDLLGCNLNLYNKDFICTKLIPDLLQMRSSTSKQYAWAGYLGGIALRVLPEKWFYKLIDSAAEGMKTSVCKNLIANCPTMWSLVPHAAYAKLAAEFIADSGHTALKEKTDKFFNAQTANSTTFPWIIENTDTKIFAVCGYGLNLPSPAGSTYMSSDFIINASSQSMGGTFANPGQTLSPEYLAGVKDKSYISPDKSADLSTSCIKDNIWVIKGQSHLDLPSGLDTVIHMCIQIAYDDNITDARTNNGGFPQFNEYRDTKAILEMLGTAFENSDFISAHTMSVDVAAEFNALRDKANALLTDKVWNAKETDELSSEMADFLKENFDVTGNWTTSSQTKARSTAEGIFKYLNKLTDIIL
ncbi:MAG: hypothetical protein WCN92_03890 [Eubacteriales bacterium]